MEDIMGNGTTNVGVVGPKGKSHRVPRFDGLVQVAFWQFAVFLMLLLLVWVNEYLDLASLWFGTPVKAPDYFEGAVLSIAVIISAIIVTGVVYEHEKRIIVGFLTVCCECRKIKMAEGAWQQLDHYVAEHSLAVFSHGLCPECFKQAMKEVDQVTGHK
jgi:uncharacterized membrane protein (DUF485 family)